MYHLTRNQQQFLRRNRSRLLLPFCVALALSGGLVSAEGKTYDYVNQWASREALEGDPIEVVNMGSGDGNVQAGTDVTNKVIVHRLDTYKDENTKETPNAYVKGHMIEILGDLGNSGGGKVSIGGDTTDSVDIKGILNNNSNSDTVVNGTEITSGYTGNWGGSLFIGNDKTKSVIMDGFGSANKAESLIQGGTISTGSLGVWGAHASFKADREFKVAKDGNTQDIGVTSGGHLSITAGSMEAGKLTVSNNNSEADIHITGEKGLHFSNSIHTGEHVKITIDSPVIRIDGDNTSGLGNSMDTTNSTVILGNDSSQITMNGRLFNAGSTVTLKGKTIHLNAFLPGNSNVNAIENTNGGYDPSGTIIGNEKTENVYVDGKTIVSSSNITLSMAGRNISLSYPKGIALVGRGGKAYIGQKETENLTIAGQVSNQSSEYLNLSGEHIKVDSTDYDGSESTQFPFSQSLVALSNDIIAGDENTKTIFITGGLNASGGKIEVQGKQISIGASNFFNTHDLTKFGNYKDGFIAYTGGSSVKIGSENSDSVHLYGGKLLASGAAIDIRGKNIIVDAIGDYMAHAKGSNITIGSKKSDIVDLSGGKLLADGGSVTILGRTISIDGNNQWAGETYGSKLIVGTEASNSVQIQGGVHTQGGGAVIQGKQIAVSSDDKSHYALDGIGGDITVGGDTAQAINVDGGIHTQGCKITLTGKDISVSKGKQENAIYTDGGTVSLKATGGDEAHISGPVKNKYGNIDIFFTGRSNHLDSQIITEETSLGTNISLTDKASWNPVNDKSNFTTYRGNDGIIHLDNDTHQTVTVSNFNDKGTWIHEDIYGSGNTGNDTIYIDKSYTGHTHFWLVNRDNTDKGVKGTILASALKKDSLHAESSGESVALMTAMPMAVSAADPIADFKANHFTASGMSNLYFKTYGLDTKDSAEEYTKDLYITDVTSHSTNEHGQHTPTVSAALAGSSLMYYTWRTENDKMLQRVGDLRENEGEETGIWARIRGSRIGRDGYRSFKNQYKVYELGYDEKTADNDRLKSFSGVAFSYLDGKGEYPGGQGTNQAVSAALYHTDIHKSGHYLDMVFRLRHLNERFHVRNTVDTDIGPITEDSHGSMNTTGVSFSAEYGRKKFIGRQWYIEPQTQWTLGYLGRNHYDMDNGTRVEQPGITSFVGRVGFNLGRQINKDSIVYLKANVSHEFGGHSPLHLYAGDENMSFTDTFDDTWFEYGAGFAVKLNEGVSLYGDFEKSAGGRFYKDWQWNAGIRYSF